MEYQSNITEVGMIPGKYFHEVQLAYNKFSQLGLNRKQYKILLLESKETLIVLFKPISSPKGQRGTIKGSPSYEVELKITDSTIVRSNYVR